MKKNLTLSIDADLLDKARVLAAMRRTSVNDMIREFFEAQTSAEAAKAARADVWSDVFKRADADATRRKRRLEAGGYGERIFDREELYEGVMRERGLL